MRNNTGPVDLAIAKWDDDRISPILEYEFGVAWTNCCGNMRISAGYMGMHWFNVVTTSTFIDAVQANNYSDVGDTLSFDGLTARAEIRW